MSQAIDRADRPEPVRIVVGVDFSQPSMRALEWAGALAARRQAMVVAVHAIEPTPLSAMAEAAESLAARAEERLAAACEPVRRHGTPCDIRCAVGRAWQVVSDAVDEGPTDLVLVGNRGMSAMKRAMIGSNADRVLRAVDAPVLVVHASDAVRDRLRVLVATDFSGESDEAVAAFRRLFLPSALRLDARVLHAVVPPVLVESVDAPLLERIDWSRFDEDATERIELVARMLRADGVEASVAVARGGAVRTILAESRAWRADLVVIGRRGMSGLERLFLGSVAERVLHGAACAVFCGHRAAVPAEGRASFIA